ncbi:MAG: DUF1700 domain-containing protein [Spirochaetaceae bacterium]|nr:DUF1700 domain-containing protein [Spirochaetaceae bacterium]
MNKQEFLRKLKHSISGLPETEKQELLADYEEHFQNAMADGKTEEEVALALGNPSQIGRSIEIEGLLSDEQPQGRGRRILRALFASTSLGFFNVLFIVGPYAALVGGMIGLWAGAASLALSGVGAILTLIVAPFFPGIIYTGGIDIALVVFASIGVSALGVLAVIGMWKLTKLFLEMTRRYVQFNLRIVKGETE